MSSPSLQNELTMKLKAFALMLKYGHDLFDGRDFAGTAALVVNNSRLLLNYQSSSLFEVVGGRAELLAQYGQSEVNSHAALALQQQKLVEKLTFAPEQESLILTAESGLNEILAANGTVYLALTLPRPRNTDGAEFNFVWLLSYAGQVPDYAVNTGKLLAHSASAALYYQRLCKRPILHVGKKARKSWLYAVFGLALIGLMFVQTPEYVTAEFTLKAPEISAQYAWFDGPIRQCYKQDGDRVKKGDLIAEYDCEQLDYRLAAAKGQLHESEAELELARQNAFVDEKLLGQVKLLEARLQTMQVAVAEAEWYLSHAKLTAVRDGILVLTDGRADNLSGKAVRTGDKLFELYGGDGMIATIPVNEREGSILQQANLTAVLFLHTEPDREIPAEILTISHYSELTEQRTYCYEVRVKVPPPYEKLRYGMRGVAKLSGGKVVLGYQWFKSVVLYFRGL